MATFGIYQKVWPVLVLSLVIFEYRGYLKKYRGLLKIPGVISRKPPVSIANHPLFNKTAWFLK